MGCNTNLPLKIVDYSNNNIPSFSGTITESLGTISNVEYQIDSTGGSWTACTANDGSFDEASEEFSCTLSSALSNGGHTIYIRSTDNNGNTTLSSNYTSDGFTIDTVSPNTEWTNSLNEKKVYAAAFPDNKTYLNAFSETDYLPGFKFTTTNDSVSGVDKYQILLKGSSDNTKFKDWKVYLDYIPGNCSHNTITDTPDRYIKCENDTISIYSKKTEDKLKDGAYQWKVRAIDKAGNNNDTNTRMLLINTHQAIFSNLYFPLTLIQVGEHHNLNLTSLDYKTIPDNYILSTSSTTPTFYGIAPVNSNIKLSISKEDASIPGLTQSSTVLEKQTNTNFMFDDTNDITRNSGELSVLNVHDADVDYIKALLDILHPDRSSEYGLWFKVICVLAYTNKNYKPLIL